MIQAVVNPDQRGNLGMHYTSVPNIMKVIKPLFLDDLYEELEKAKGHSKKLRQLLDRISKLKIFDPACGSGNFLIIAYKELRKLEINIWKEILDTEPQRSLIYTKIQLSQFYGIEIDDFAHEIAKLSLWLAEHQMNKYFENQLELGKSNPILPLKASGNITHANATRIDWEDVCPKSKDDEIYLMGNPPYLGSRNQDDEQKEDLKAIFRKDYKSLDYVTAWFYKGANYIRNINAELAFVSTNSICQGDLVAKTWPRILKTDIEIGFAYQSFKWTNNAKSNAGVTVIIVSLRNKSNYKKYIFIDDLKKSAKSINCYLVDSEDIIVKSKNKSISGFPRMNFGNMPADGGNLILSENEKDELTKKEPQSEKFIKECIGAHEFLNGKNRYCIWLEDVSEENYEKSPSIKKRVNNNYTVRVNSSRPHLAEIPHLFAQITQPPNKNFILIPRVSSERRDYIPIGFFSSDKVSLDSCLIVATQEPWLYGVLTSKMHMAWVRAVGGKLKTDYRYSAKICYNTFPFPEVSKVKKANIEENVFAVLEEREKHPEKTMAELYDPDKMPKGLGQAHKELDEAVERCYRLQPFQNDTQRLEYLFKEYEKLIKKDTLFEPARRGGKQKKTKRKKKVK
jgi:type I restriction-modification system DNA methylase subunit